jgi:uncharacterized protein (TIGR03435 family)
VTLEFAPDENMLAALPPSARVGAAPPPEAPGPSIFAALQEQLGLKLESQKALVDVIVIDHLDHPSAN